MSYLHVR